MVEQNEKIKKIGWYLDSLIKEYNVIEEDLINCMLKQNLQAIQNEYGNFPIGESVHASVNKFDEQQLFEWLRMIGDGAKIKETIHFKTFDSLITREIKTFMDEQKSKKLMAQFIKEMKEQKKVIGELPDFISIFIKQKIKMPKVKDLECNLVIQE